MSLKLFFLPIILSLSLLSVLCVLTSPIVSGQVSPPSTTVNGSSSNGSAVNNGNSTNGLGSPNVIKKLEGVSSLSNIVGISIVDGVKLSGIRLGDTDVSVTLRYQPIQPNPANKSLPVTVIVTKLPVANLTQLISLVESSKATAMSTSNAGSLDSLLGQQGMNPMMGNNALQILSLVKNIQLGAGSIVTGNWTAPQTISMGLLGSMRGGDEASAVPNDFVTVVVVPFMGESAFPSIPLN
jgi:hypothetical protein